MEEIGEVDGAAVGCRERVQKETRRSRVVEDIYCTSVGDAGVEKHREVVPMPVWGSLLGIFGSAASWAKGNCVGMDRWIMEGLRDDEGVALARLD